MDVLMGFVGFHCRLMVVFVGNDPRFGQFIQFDYGQATFGMPDHVKSLGPGISICVSIDISLPSDLVR